MNRPDYFIVTSDPLTASQLRTWGFRCVLSRME